VYRPACGKEHLSRAAAARASSFASKAVVRGAAWILFGYTLMLVLRFGSNLVLTWYLAPRILGVMALVNLLIVGLHMFSDLGIRQCVIQSPRGDDPVFLRTAWTLQVLRGLLLWFCSGLIAWPLASFYGEPALMWLVPVVGATAALGGLDSTSMFTLSRRLQRGRLVCIDVGSYVVSQAVVVAWVWWIAPPGGSGDDPGLRNSQLIALAVGSVLSGVFETVISYLVMPGFRHRFCLEKEARSQLLRFGGWVFVSTACMFLAAQADRLVVGRISLDVLGVYHVAATLASIPTLLMATLGSQLVFPLYSRALHSGRDSGTVFPRVHLLFAGFAALLATGLAGAGPTLVHCLYRDRYEDAGMYMQLLTVSAWFTMLQGTRELILLSTGRTRALAIGHALRLLSLPPLLLAGFAWGGLPGMILGFAGAEFLRYTLNVWLTRSLGLSHLLQDAALSLLILVVSLASSRLDPMLADQTPRLARFALEGVFVAAIWAVVYAAWRLYTAVRRGSSPALPLPEEARP
jgi:O-antigen/teichoic acid export membrane protein